MLYRTTSLAELEQAVEPFIKGLDGLVPVIWIKDYRNIAVSDGNNNVALFEAVPGTPGTYTGHYFFQEAKGRKAIDLSKQMLEFVFKMDGVEAIRGLTPVENKAARWMSRRVGFKSYGEVDTKAGPAELFILTKDEYKGTLNDG